MLVSLVTCKVDFTSKNDGSSILLIPEDGDFKIKVLTTLSDGRILLAGYIQKLNVNGTQVGTDTSKFYIIDPNTRNITILKNLSKRYGYLYGAVGTPDGGMLIHFESFDKSSASLVRLDKNYKTTDSIYSNAHLSADKNSINNYNTIIRLKDENYIVQNKYEYSTICYDGKLNEIWKKNKTAFSSFQDIEAVDGSIWSAGWMLNSYSNTIRKIEKSGNMKFLKVGNLTSQSGYFDIIEYGGKYLASGFLKASPIDSGSADAVITTFDQNGIEQGHKFFATIGDDYGMKLIPTEDGGFVFVTSRIIQGSTMGIRLLKLNSEMGILWEREIIKPGKTNMAPLAIKLKDQSIVIGRFGESGSLTFNGLDASLIFLDKNGNFL